MKPLCPDINISICFLTVIQEFYRCGKQWCEDRGKGHVCACVRVSEHVTFSVHSEAKLIILEFRLF